MIKTGKYLSIIIFSGLLTVTAFGQGELQREVRVVKPYTPTLSDARKISLLPEFYDTLTYTTDFEYGITPRKYSTDFRLNPIKPAKMVGLPLTRLYKSRFTLGLGNYDMPYAELTINQLRNRKNAIGLYAKHHSSTGKVKLENDAKVDAPFSNNELELYGRRMFRRSTLEANLSGGYDSWLYYGFNPLFDTTINNQDKEQKIYSAGANVLFYSTHPDSLHFNYSAGLGYYFIDDHWDFTEQGINFDFEASKFIGDWFAEIGVGAEVYNRSENMDSTDNAIIRVNPAFSRATSDWRFKVGLNSAFDTKAGQTDMGLYPVASFEFNIVENVLIPYMGVTGEKKTSTYKSMLKENPFIVPGLIVENEDHAIKGYIGLKGRYSSRMSYDFNVNYSRINNMHLFVNNYLFLNPINQFRVTYDNVDVLNANAEVIWNQSEKLKFTLLGSYYDYSEDVWHKANFETHLNASYNLRDKILVNTDFFYTGNRKALLEYSGMDTEIKDLSGFFDGNIKVEYRYTRLLSFFLTMSNFSASRYENWYLYPVQRFQVMAGFSYAL
ncbi:MAG: hypothetical protein IH594_06175 [Bacteroidales bacterium]|nr:hypothetical protein [Bacteroidales bacterium]